METEILLYGGIIMVYYYAYNEEKLHNLLYFCVKIQILYFHLFFCFLRTTYLSLADMLKKCSDGHYPNWVCKFKFPMALQYSLNVNLFCILNFCISFLGINTFPKSSWSMVKKNPAYGRHQLSRPLQIEAPIPIK